jgi:TonB family protein
MMLSTHWKLGVLVSALHVVLFVTVARLGLEPLDRTNQSVITAQLVESKSINSTNAKVTPSIAERPIPKSQGFVHSPLARDDGLLISNDSNTSELMSASITPPSPDAYALRNPKPPYPISSRENGEQGAVMLHACITDHGKVERVDLAQSSGYPALDRSALNTIRHWSFRPAQESGKAISMCYRLPIRFLLSASVLPAALA